MVTTRETTYDADGLTMVGHLARPDGEGPWPAVLIAHDGVGLDDFQRRRADHLAEQGYVALAMEYHGGQYFYGDPDAMLARALPLLADPDRMRAIGRAALDVLLAAPGVDPDRLAALGYGAGGNIVLELAQAGAPFRGVAVIHPAPPSTRPQDWATVTATFLLATGSEDPICTPNQLLEFGHTLQDAGIDWRMGVYGGAKHAFWYAPTNPDGSLTAGTTHVQATPPGVGQHPAHTARSWRAVLDLLDETIGALAARA